MATYLTDTKLAKPLAGEEGWSELFDYNWSLLDRINTVHGFYVTPREIPSTSLYVSVGGSSYVRSDGSLSDRISENVLLPGDKQVTLFINCATDAIEFYAGTGGPLIDGFLDFPTTPHVPLALVYTTGTIVRSITDYRVFGHRVYTQLVDAANDAAAAAAGVAVNCYYRDGSVMMLRVS